MEFQPASEKGTSLLNQIETWGMLWDFSPQLGILSEKYTQIKSKMKLNYLCVIRFFLFLFFAWAIKKLLQLISGRNIWTDGIFANLQKIGKDFCFTIPTVSIKTHILFCYVSCIIPRLLYLNLRPISMVGFINWKGFIQSILLLLQVRVWMFSAHWRAAASNQRVELLRNILAWDWACLGQHHGLEHLQRSEEMWGKQCQGSLGWKAEN